MSDTSDQTPQYDTNESVVRVNWTVGDVLSIAEELGVDKDVAVERAEEWGRYIADTASNLVAEQLRSVIEHGQP